MTRACLIVLRITDENKSFSISKPRQRCSREGDETTERLQKLMVRRSKNDVELPVEEVGRRSNQIKTGENEYNLSNLDTHRNEIIEKI